MYSIHMREPLTALPTQSQWPGPRLRNWAPSHKTQDSAGSTQAGVLSPVYLDRDCHQQLSLERQSSGIRSWHSLWAVLQQLPVWALQNAGS